MMMPTMSTCCCSRRGTANWAMIRTKTNRLSMERLYSNAHPVMKSPRVLPTSDIAEEHREQQREPDVEDHPESGLLRRRMCGRSRMRSRSPIRMIVRTTIEVISNQTGISKGALHLSRRGRE